MVYKVCVGLCGIKTSYRKIKNEKNEETGIEKLVIANNDKNNLRANHLDSKQLSTSTETNVRDKIHSNEANNEIKKLGKQGN